MKRYLPGEPDFRALCAELVDELQAYGDGSAITDGEVLECTDRMLDRARAALAANPGPAPAFALDAAYPGAPGWAKPGGYQSTPQTDAQIDASLRQAFRKAIDDGVVDRLPVANPAPAAEGGPTEQEVDELCCEHGFHYEDDETLAILVDIIRAAVARYGTPTPVQAATVYHQRDIGDGRPVLIAECEICGVSPANVDDCGQFGNSKCSYFGVDAHVPVPLSPAPSAKAWPSDEEISELAHYSIKAGKSVEWAIKTALSRYAPATP